MEHVEEMIHKFGIYLAVGFAINFQFFMDTSFNIWKHRDFLIIHNFFFFNYITYITFFFETSKRYFIVVSSFNNLNLKFRYSKTYDS